MIGVEREHRDPIEVPATPTLPDANLRTVTKKLSSSTGALADGQLEKEDAASEHRDPTEVPATPSSRRLRSPMLSLLTFKFEP